MKFIKILVITSVIFFASLTQAAFITDRESELDSIFSQASFGQTPIDIRVGPATELVFPDLLSIDSEADINALFDLHVGSQNVVNFYFVDTISYCGSFNTAIVGCGETPGQDFAIESSFAAGGFGAELLAHELAHNLGLPHTAGGLMAPSLNNSTVITASEVATILASPLVQFDTLLNTRWIDINPVLIVSNALPPANNVSEPGLLFIVLAYAGYLLRARVKPPVSKA